MLNIETTSANVADEVISRMLIVDYQNKGRKKKRRKAQGGVKEQIMAVSQSYLWGHYLHANVVGRAITKNYS